jgi:beta-lactamase superfamily II metal-dependent hydrolase
VSDLPDLRGAVHVDSISRNPTIPPDALRKLKEEAGGVTSAMAHAIHLHETYTAPAPLRPHREKLEFRNFYNPYGTFSDTNNLSYVTFLHGPRFDAVLPGDLEIAGWRRLLQDEDFRAHLRRTRIFIASHHGRESGYCPEVFSICQPEVVVFSDSAIKFATQEMASTYANHATGTTFCGTRRQVLSTRNDGTFWWDIGV